MPPKPAQRMPYLRPGLTGNPGQLLGLTEPISIPARRPITIVCGSHRFVNQRTSALDPALNRDCEADHGAT